MAALAAFAAHADGTPPAAAPEQGQDTLAAPAPRPVESNPQDTLAAYAAQPAGPTRQDTLAADVPMPRVSYVGAGISAVVPGGGQVYHGRYFMGGVFLTAEAGAAGFSIYWWDRSNQRVSETARLRDEASRLRDSATLTDERGGAAVDTAALLSLAGLYSVRADRSEFEARKAKSTATNALALALGIHFYSFMDALELDGLTARGEAKDPTRAGLLAAVPFLGLGQLYNARPGKAGMMAVTQVSLMTAAINHHRLMNAASDKYNEMRDSTSAQYAYRADHLSYWKSSYDNAFSRRNTYLWISLFAYLYSIFDAVVDAHLSDYEEKIRVNPDLSTGVDGGYRASLAVTVGF
jgi:hypothetical protein